MAYFARVTKEAPAGQANVVIMGRKTWESIPKSKRPLVGRINVVITHKADYGLTPSQSPLPSYLENSLGAGLSRVAAAPSCELIHRRFMIGGASVYQEALALEKTSLTSPVVDRILLTQILSPAFEDCDVFFPDFKDVPGWTRASHADLETWAGFEVAKGVQEENGVEYEFQMWVRNV